MKLLIFFLFIKLIYSEEGEEILSACENQTSPNNAEDCLQKSCEFIEEKCCYLETRNFTTNSIEKECIDFNVYDYMRKDLKNEAINKIKNGQYWEDYDLPYDEIITLKCQNEYIYPMILLPIILLIIIL